MHIWQTLFHALPLNPTLITAEYDRIKACYSEKGRHYHGWGHIEALLSLADLYGQDLADKKALAAAIFYHDAVYSPFRSDNEERSAEMAAVFLKKAGLGEAFTGKTVSMILATKTHLPDGHAETPFLLDIDLSVLGADTAVYEAYTQNIRKEYGKIPWFLYKKGRKKVLQNFLERSRIYHTDFFKNLWEDSARENIRREIGRLA